MQSRPASASGTPSDYRKATGRLQEGYRKATGRLASFRNTVRPHEATSLLTAHTRPREAPPLRSAPPSHTPRPHTPTDPAQPTIAKESRPGWGQPHLTPAPQSHPGVTETRILEVGAGPGSATGDQPWAGRDAGGLAEGVHLDGPWHGSVAGQPTPPVIVSIGRQRRWRRRRAPGPREADSSSEAARGGGELGGAGGGRA